MRSVRYLSMVLAVALGIAVESAAFDWDDPRLWIPDLAAGLGLILAGMIVLAARRQGAVGPVTLLLGVAWLAVDWIGWHRGLPSVRSLAMVAAPYLMPLMLHLLALWPARRLGSAAMRFGVALVYGAATVFALGQALFRNPVLDPRCWNNCTDNVLLWTHIPLVSRLLDDGWRLVVVATGISCAALAVRKLGNTTRVRKRSLMPVLVPAATVALTEAARALAQMANRLENPADPVFGTLFAVEALSLVAISTGVAAAALRAGRVNRSISRLAKELGDAAAPGSLATSLSRSLGDPGLRVVYWLPESGRYVDSEGRSVEPPIGERAVTSVVRGGQPLALVIHDRGLIGADELEHKIGAAAMLAVDNERLRAELLAQVEDLKTSRMRIVEDADIARRRLERDLHDGAQQRVLALLYEFQLAAKAAASRSDQAAKTFLDLAVTDVQLALAELRDIAHGIYPVVLTESGLAGALGSLRNSAVIPVEVESLLDGRLSNPIESAAYIVAAESVRYAAERGATYATIHASIDADWLALEVKDDGLGRRGPMIHLSDRVGALGGRFVADPGVVRAELPCG